MSVSVVMVVRDEPRSRVQRALDAVAIQEGVDGISVVIAAPEADHADLAGLSTTGAVAEVRLVANPTGGRSAGLNRAIAAAPDGVVVRVDARSVVPPGYVAACVARLAVDLSVGIVGGGQRPTAIDDDAGPRGIARALRNPWLLGNAAYRRPGAAGPVDTVYLGAFRRDEVLALGGYDERLVANEDFDLARRVRDQGKVVWLEPDLEVAYEPRADWGGLARQYHAFGVAKVRFWRLTGERPNRRQQVAIAGGALAGIAALLSLRRPGRALALAVAACVGGAMLDHVADPDERDLQVRSRALAASAVIVTSWLVGVLSGLLRPGRDLR